MEFVYDLIQIVKGWLKASPSFNILQNIPFIGEIIDPLYGAFIIGFNGKEPRNFYS